MNKEMITFISLVIGGVILVMFVGFPILLSLFYKKVTQGKTIVRNGLGGAKVSFTGMTIIPVLHFYEIMDVSVKRVEIAREGKDGLICKDNLRADIRVAFFVRVNHAEEDVLRVAKSLGTQKASDTKTLMTFFDAKFSEALKTVGKKFDFVQLYTEREKFKHEILQVIGTDLNGYVLDDAAIDYLEQTDLNFLNPKNVMDAEGIKKITDLTAKQAVLSNQIQRNKEKTIVEQDVSAKEAVLELEKQQAEAEAKQRREIENIKSRENAQIEVVEAEERLKAETVRIKTEEELAIAEENKQRQIIVAKKAKETTEAVEQERVEKQKLLEKTEKEKLVALAEIEKDKKVETENKSMQEVIRERIIVEKAVVEEEEKIKDTKAIAEAKRVKEVEKTKAESKAEVEQIEMVKKAEAEKESTAVLAEKDIIIAETALKTSYKEAESKKILADAKAEEVAVDGLSESRVIKAKAEAYEADGKSKANVVKLQAEAEAKAIEMKALAKAKGLEAEGTSEAKVIEVKSTSKAKGLQAEGTSEAKVIELKASAKAKGTEAEGLAEAKVIKEKASSEAKGIDEKAAAMKKFDAVGREHEEFKLKLNKEKEIELAQITINKDIAQAQAEVLKEGLKSANIDIVGGDNIFFDKLISSVIQGKKVDGLVNSSKVLTDVKDTFFSGDAKNFKEKLKGFISNFNINTEDIKNLTISSAISKLMGKTTNRLHTDILTDILNKATELGLENDTVKTLLK